MQSACDEISSSAAPGEPRPAGWVVEPGTSAQYSICGGSVLVRRWIQTPSVAKVRSAVQREGEVVLGASPPARRLYRVATTRLVAPWFRPTTPSCGQAAGRSGIRRPHGKARTASSVVAASGDDAA